MEDFGLSLVEAARRSGVTVAEAREPQDKFVEINGLRLHYLDWGGEGNPTMLCLHGGSQNAHMWDFTALAYCHRYHILSLDQRGHGDSQWAPDGDYSTDAHQQDIKGFVDTLGLEPFVLVGLSMGGINSYTFTSNNPQNVRALVVVDIGPETRREGGQRITRFVTQEDVLDSFEAFVQRTQQYNFRRPEWQIRGSLRHNLRQLPDGRWTWKYDTALRDPERRARQGQIPDTASRWALWEGIRCPTLLVRGANSDILDGEVAQQMQKRLSGSRLVEISGAGHLVPGDNPIEFEKTLGVFLNEIEIENS